MTLDPDRTIALAYAPADRREALRAFLLLDATFGAVLAGGREAGIKAIKLAWWREALERLDTDPPPPEPVLQALAAHVLPIVSGAKLAEMEQGWAALLQEGPLEEGALERFAETRGGLLFAYAGRLLGGDGSGGRLWALVDLARHSDEVDAAAALAKASSEERAVSAIRPLRILSLLAERDVRRGLPLEPLTSRRRRLALLRYAILGR